MEDSHNLLIRCSFYTLHKKHFLRISRVLTLQCYTTNIDNLNFTICTVSHYLYFLPLFHCNVATTSVADKCYLQTASFITVIFLCRRIYGQLLSLWDGCETYFVRSIARLTLLNTSLQNPAKDLGPPAIERCRGFAVHLMVIDTVLCVAVCL